MSRHYGRVIIRTVFPQPSIAHIARRSPWHVLSKQRSCPLITGFSSIRVWVTQPRQLLGAWGISQFWGKWGGTRFICLYKGIRIPHFYPGLLPHLLIHSRTLELQRPSPSFLRTVSHVWSRRQVGGFYRDGGDHPLASRSGHAWSGLRRKTRTWALELERAKMDKQG